jgi:hypothetical protein
LFCQSNCQDLIPDQDSGDVDLPNEYYFANQNLASGPLISGSVDINDLNLITVLGIRL